MNTTYFYAKFTWISTEAEQYTTINAHIHNIRHLNQPILQSFKYVSTKMQSIPVIIREGFLLACL